MRRLLCVISFVCDDLVKVLFNVVIYFVITESINSITIKLKAKFDDIKCSLFKKLFNKTILMLHTFSCR